MIYFTLSAPSKLSLCGEYAVKYGKKGLTAGIDLRTTLTFTELSHLKLSIIHINFLQINILLSIPLMRFLAFYRSCTFNEDNNELREQVLQFITSNRCSFRTEHQRAITQSFIYLLAYISHKEEIDITSFSVHLSTQLMIDGNFVCLASFTVCVAAALLRWSRLQKGAFDNFDTNDLRKIHSYAARCEQITHECGTANVAACTYGSIMLYQTGKILHYIPFFDIMNVKILLVDSKQELNLEARTQRVVELMNKDPETAHYIFACIDGAINVATHALQNLAPTYTNAELDLESKRLILMMQHNILLVSNLLKFHKMSFYYIFELYFCIYVFSTFSKQISLWIFIIYKFL